MSDDQQRIGSVPDSELPPDGGHRSVDGFRDTRREFRTITDAPVPEAEGPDPRYFLRVLHKWRWSAAAVFVLIVAGTAVHTYTTVPIYQTRVRILIEPERVNLLSITDVVEQDRSIETQMAVLQSRWLAKEVMEALELFVSAAPAGGASPHETAAARGPVWWRGMQAWWSGVQAYWSDEIVRVRQVVGWPPETANQTPISDPVAIENAEIDSFLAGLSVVWSAKGVLDITYTSPEPALAARIANGIAEQYIAQNLEQRFAAIQEVSDWLAARLSEQRQRVDASEQALRRFREQNQITPAGVEDPIVGKLNQLAAALTRAETVRLEKEVTLDRIESLRGNPSALLRLPELAADPLVPQLRLEVERLRNDRAQMGRTLQDRHPDMIKLQAAIQAAQQKLDAETERVIATIRADVATARTTEENLAAALDEQRDEVRAQNLRSVELGMLEREASSTRQIYEMLMQRARETSITKDIRPNQVRILDAADVPREPIAPRPSRQMALAIIVGLIAALGVALGFDQLDNRVKTPEEITGRLGLPFLGLLPEIDVRKHGSPVMIDKVTPMFVEAMRSIRTNIIYSFADESLKAVVVTSASLSEGKTIVASNLAIALAQAGERVLLVDADMRRPTLHHHFRVNRNPGLSDLLVGKVKASDVIMRPVRTEPNLWLLPCGHPPPDPPELLGSHRLQNVLTALEGHFDWVVLDSPPIMAVTDASVLAHRSSGVLFVIGAERVTRPVARRALEQLARVDARLVGAILSRVDLKRNAYYYSKYYHRRYEQYAASA